MSRAQRHAKSTTQPKTGSFATLSNLPGGPGSSAPSSGRLRAALAVLALAICAFAATASAASAAPLAAKMETISSVSYASAHVTGKISSPCAGLGGFTTYSFQYSTDSANWTSAPNASGSFTFCAPFEDKEVQGDIEGLKGATEYFVRLRVFNANEAIDPAAPPYPSFTTLPVASPTVVKTDNASEVKYTTAMASGEIERPANPDPAFDANCRFEYVTDAKFDATGFAEAAPAVPCGIDSLTTPNEKKQVEVPLTELAPGTEYHLRLTASNAGPDASLEAAQTFTTLTVGPPSVISTANASEVEYTQAQVKGVVERPNTSSDPAFDVNCNFEYVTDEQFTNNPPGEEFAGATPVACEPEANPTENPITATGPTPVKAELIGLAASTAYHFRLSASNQGGSDSKEAAAPFTTQGPIPAPTVIATDDASEVTIHEAKVKGEVERPAGNDPALNTSCRFEYVSDQQFNETGFEGAAQTQCQQTEGGPITTAGSTPVSAELTGLRPGTTFHLRLAAENSGGTETKDAADTFTTLPAELPTVTIDPVEGGIFTTAHVSGAVTLTDGHGSGSEPYLQVSSDGGATWSSSTMLWSPTFGPSKGVFSNGLIAAGEGTYIVKSNRTGLQPSTTYLFRIASSYNNEFTNNPASGISEIEARGEVAFSPEPNPSITTEPPQAAPTASLDPITPPTGDTVHLSGTVDPHAPAGPLSPPAKAAYESKWQLECTPECIDLANPSLSGIVQGEEGAQPISVDAIRLAPNTFYEVKLTAKSEGGSETTAAQTFQTPLIPATVKSEAGASDGEGGYTIQGVVDSNNSKLTDCHFEYGTTANYSPHNTYEAPCLPFPSGPDEVQNLGVEATEGQFKLSFRGQTTSDLPFDATAAEVQTALRGLSSIGSSGVNVTGTPGACVITFAGKFAGANIEPIKASEGTTPLGGGAGASVSTATEGGTNHPVAVEAHLENLTIGSIYHFRIFTTNAAGQSSSTDRQFTPMLAPAKQGCENEAIREENSSLALPECRAFEMVTPAAKEGYGAGLADFDGGDAVAYESQAGNIANSGMANGTHNWYTAIRTPTGWQTRANLNGPSGSVYSSPENVASKSVFEFPQFSQDLLSTYWELGKAGAQGNAYIRKPDGTFHLIGNGSATDSSHGSVSFRVGFSADLSHVVYGPSNGGGPTTWGPGVYEFIGTGNDQPRRVDLDNSGAPVSSCIGHDPGDGNPVGNAKGNSISVDGSTIVFTAYGGCGANPPADEIWARVGGTTSYDVSASECTRTGADPCNAPSNPTFQSATPDGSRVFFTTTQQLLNGDTDQTNDLYACDIPPGNPAPISGPANPCSSLTEISGAATGADVQNVIASSEDGSTVLFNAKGVLAHNTDAFGEEAVAGDNNLYVWRQDAAHPTGETTFIAPNVGGSAQVTPDGRYLALDTANSLLPTDTDNSTDVYRYDADSGQLIRASTGPTGTGGNADGFNADFAGVRGNPGQFEHNSHYAISNDGQKIVFNTAEALSPLDGNGGPDIYLWTPGHVSDISLGSGEQGVIDGSGEDIYFDSGAVLTPGDGDQRGDVYDARVGGGFSFAETTCSGEDCQASASGPPVSPAPVSGQSPADPGNVKPCPKGKVAKGSKCVKKKPKKHSGKKHHGKKHKRAGSNHGGSK